MIALLLTRYHCISKVRLSIDGLGVRCVVYGRGVTR